MPPAGTSSGVALLDSNAAALLVVAEDGEEPIPARLDWVDALGRVRPELGSARAEDGRIALRAWSADREARLSSPGFFPRLVPRSALVPEGPTIVRLERLHLGRVVGHVLDESGSPLPAASVSLEASGWPAQKWFDFLQALPEREGDRFSIQASEQGRFEFSASPCGIPVRISAAAPSRVAASLTLPPLAGGQGVEGVELRLRPGHRIRVRVTSRNTGAPIAGAWVWPVEGRSDAWAGAPWCSGARTDADGSAVLTATDPGNYDVRVSAGDGYTRAEAVVSTGQEDNQIQLFATRAIDVQFEFDESARRLADARTNSTDGSIRLLSGYHVAQRLLARMHFRCRSLENGEEVATSNFAWVEYPSRGTLISPVSPPLHLAAYLGDRLVGSCNVAASEARVPVSSKACAQGGLSLRFLTPMGEPHVGEVRLLLAFSADSSSGPATSFDQQIVGRPAASGDWRIAGLACGHYVARVETMDRGWTSAPFEFDVLPGEDATRDPYLVTAPSTLVVDVLAGAGTPFAVRVWSHESGEFCVLDHLSGIPQYEAASVSGLPLELAPLPSGACRVEVRADGRAPIFEEISLVPGVERQLLAEFGVGERVVSLRFGASRLAGESLDLTITADQHDGCVVYQRRIALLEGSSQVVALPLVDGQYLLSVEGGGRAWVGVFFVPQDLEVEVPDDL